MIISYLIPNQRYNSNMKNEYNQTKYTMILFHVCSNWEAWIWNELENDELYIVVGKNTLKSWNPLQVSNT